VVIATHNESLVQRFPHPVTRLRDGAVEIAGSVPPGSAPAARPTGQRGGG
jgi:hypothetical protein